MKTIYILVILLTINYYDVFAGLDVVVNTDSLHYFIPDTVYYGKQLIRKDSILKYIMISNKDTNKGLNLTASKFIKIYDPDTLFTSNFVTPTEVPKNSNKDVRIVLKTNSRRIGRVAAIFRLYYYNSNNTNLPDSISLPLYVDFVEDTTKYWTSEITIPGDTMKVSEKFNLPFILSKYDEPFDVDSLNITFSYDASVMCPDTQLLTGKLNFGQYTISIARTFKQTPKTGDLLFSVPMIATLGDVAKTDIVINKSDWSSKTLPVEDTVKFKNGSLNISDIFYYGDTPRLITMLIDTLSIDIPQNIISSDFTVGIKYKGIAKLQIYSYYGDLISEYFTNIAVHRDYTEEMINISRGIFPVKGIYIFKLSNELDFVSKMVVIE